jgi:hypothetical protein
VEKLAAHGGEEFLPFLEFLCGGLCLEFAGFLDKRINDVRLAAGFELLAASGSFEVSRRPVTILPRWAGISSSVETSRSP